jgi:polyphosphate kinase 2
VAKHGDGGSDRRSVAEVADALGAVRLRDLEQRLPHPERLKGKPYEAELLRLQIELTKLQDWVQGRGERVLIVFEGRDAAGKGGAIKRFTEHLNPRVARVVALPKPSDVERTQWYFQRYVPHLPAAGQIVMFDRSWYNRAGVELVMQYCTESEYARFLRQVPDFEALLADDGIHLVKLWFTVDEAEQRRRFEGRATDPLKKWKLSPTDLEAVDRYAAYSRARNSLLTLTDTHAGPWTVINSNDKKRARLESIRHVLSRLPYDGKDESVAHAPDPFVVQPAAELKDKLAASGD